MLNFNNARTRSTNPLFVSQKLKASQREDDDLLKYQISDDKEENELLESLMGSADRPSEHIEVAKDLSF